MAKTFSYDDDEYMGGMKDASLTERTGKLSSSNDYTGFTDAGVEDAAKKGGKLSSVPGMGENVHGFTDGGIKDAASKGGKLVEDFCIHYQGFEGSGMAEAGKKGGKLEKF